MNAIQPIKSNHKDSKDMDIYLHELTVTDLNYLLKKGKRGLKRILKLDWYIHKTRKEYRRILENE